MHWTGFFLQRLIKLLRSDRDDKRQEKSFYCEKVFLEKLKFEFDIFFLNRHLTAKTQREWINTEIKVKTLKRYSVTEHIAYTPRLKFSYKPMEDRIRLQNTSKTSLRTWHSSSVLATLRMVSRPLVGYPGTFLGTQMFCPNPDLNQIPHFNKFPK